MADELTRTQMDERLRSTGTGVLALTNGTETYAVPESFGYDGECVYFQFVHHDDSRKMAFLETTDVATHVVYTTRPAASVVIRGPVERVPSEERERAAAAMAENGEVPTLNVDPSRDTDELSFEFYRLVPEEITGRAFDAAACALSPS